MYLIFGALAGLVGSALSFIIRLELSSGGKTYLLGNYEAYNVVVTSHGLIMIFFLLTISMEWICRNQQAE